MTHWISPRFLVGMISLATIDDSVIIPPPPMPVRISISNTSQIFGYLDRPAIARAAMSIPMLFDRPHSSVPAVKRNIAIRIAGLRPMMSDSLP